MIYIYKKFSDRPAGYVFLLLGTIFMLVGLALLAFAVIQRVQEQGYQAGQCTITAKQLQHEVSTSDRAGQQAIVDHYNIGQIYQCWYNPADPNQAILVRQINWVVILKGGGFLLLGILFATIGILTLLGLFRPGGRSWRYSSGG
jgi:hypothetical protein